MATTTPNLLIGYVEPSQNNKETTLNQALNELDLALTNLLSLGMADADVTLTTGEGNQALANMVFVMTGANTAARNVIVPVNKKFYVVSNQTTGGFKITVKTPSGSGVDILATDGYVFCYCDGTNIIAAGGSGSGGVGGINSKSADYALQASDLGTNVVLSTGNHTFTVPNPPPSSKWFCFILNENPGASPGLLTVGHNGLNLNGIAGDLTLSQNEGIVLFADGTNYLYLSCGGSGGGSSTLAGLADVLLASVADGDLLTYDSASSRWKNKQPSRTAAIKFTIDGGGSVPTTGVYGQISLPYACTITGWNLTGDAAGSAVIDVLRSTGGAFPTTASIAGTDKPTLSSAQRAHDTALSGWGSTALSLYDEVQISLASVTTIKRLDLTIYISIP